MQRRAVLLAVLVVAGLVIGCGAPAGGQVAPGAGTGGPAQLQVQVEATAAHDPELFTQGLTIAPGVSSPGLVLYDGTGLRGQSLLRATALSPGLRPGRVLAQKTLADDLFGEGIAVVGDRVWQWTWKRGVAIERDRQTLNALRRVRYRGQGWGLCFDGQRLVASDGSARLTFRDPATFAPTGGVRVTLDGQPQPRINELECVDGSVWANVWQTDRILRIDPATGRVTGVVDASGLLTPEQRAEAGVLNGIAAIPGTDEFLMTGKNWPTLFRVRFVPA